MQNKEQISVADQIGLVKAKLAAIDQEMPELPTLTSEQRQARKHETVGPKKLDLLDNRVEEAKQNKKVLPPRFDLAQLEEQAKTLRALAALLVVLAQLRQKVSDGMVVLGKPALVNAATAMSYIKVASANKQRLKPTDLVRKAARAASVPTASPPVPLGEANPPSETTGAPVSQAA